MPAAIPVVEVADDRDVVRVRRPDREVIARHAAHGGRVGAELVVEPEVAPLVEEIQVLRPQPRLIGTAREAVGGPSEPNGRYFGFWFGGLAHGVLIDAVGLGELGKTYRNCGVGMPETRRANGGG